MSTKNSKTRIEFTHQEIEAIRTLALDRLKGEGPPRIRIATLGGLLIKTDRARGRVKTLVTG